MNPDEPVPDPFASASPPRVSQRSGLKAAAAEYARTLTSWFKNSEGALRAKEHEILTQARLGAPGLRAEVVRLTELAQSLRAYQQQIHEALARALEIEIDPQPPGPPREAGELNSAVQRTLDAIQKSIEGWLRMKEIFPEQTDEILSLLVQLDRLRRSIQAEFSSR